MSVVAKGGAVRPGRQFSFSNNSHYTQNAFGTAVRYTYTV